MKINGGEKKENTTTTFYAAFMLVFYFFKILNSAFLNYREERNKVAKEWLLSIGKIHSQCPSMKIFPLRADLEIFYFPLLPCRLKWHQKCPPRHWVNIKCRKNRIPDWFGWAGRWEEKSSWRYPLCCQIFPNKETSWCFSHLPRELLPSFCPFCLSKPSEPFCIFTSTDLFSFECKKKKNKKYHGLDQEGTLRVFIYSFQLPDFF